MGFAEILEAHNDDVCHWNYCPHGCPHGCGDRKSSLRVHELIRRQVRFIEDGMVHCAAVQVYVWSCRLCCRSFRHLPPFLEPLKRYVNGAILDRASSVLSRPRKAYRDVALNDPPRQTGISYHDGSGRSISHTTIWRWIQWMGALMKCLLSSHPEVAKEEDPDSFEFSLEQAVKPEYMENLYLARQLLLGSYLTPE